MRVVTKRRMAVVVGAGTVVLSLLGGALTSAAAAQDTFGTFEVVEPAPADERDSKVIEREATNQMRVEEKKHPMTTGRLAIGQGRQALHQACQVTFDGPEALFVQENQSNDTIVRDDWREPCGSRWTEVIATKHHHLHLGFADPEITLCTSGPLAQQFAFVDDDYNCTAIDPLTEPRSSPYVHVNSEVLEFRMYDADGYQPFRLDEIRVRNNNIRLCAQKQPPADTLVSNANDGSSSTQCWTLEPGLWNLASYTSNTKLVTITGAQSGGSPFSIDDLSIVNQ